MFFTFQIFPNFSKLFCLLLFFGPWGSDEAENPEENPEANPEAQEYESLEKLKQEAEPPNLHAAVLTCMLIKP